MGIITESEHITTNKGLNHNGSEGDRIEIHYTPNGGNKIIIFEEIIDSNKIINYKFKREEMTNT